MSKYNDKERENCKRVYLRLIKYLLHHIKTLESYERIFHFVQDEAMSEVRRGGG